MKVYNRQDLVAALISAERHKKSHADLRSYYGKKFEALEAAFNVHVPRVRREWRDEPAKPFFESKTPNQNPPVKPDWWDKRMIEDVAGHGWKKPLTWDDFVAGKDNQGGVIRHSRGLSTDLGMLIGSVLRSRAALQSPTSGYLTAPVAVGVFVEGMDWYEPLIALEENYERTLGDLIGVCCGLDDSTTVTEQELKDIGYDTTQNAPDLFDYI